jgi:hypothetical protein
MPNYSILLKRHYKLHGFLLNFKTTLYDNAGIFSNLKFSFLFSETNDKPAQLIQNNEAYLNERDRLFQLRGRSFLGTR